MRTQAPRTVRRKDWGGRRLHLPLGYVVARSAAGARAGEEVAVEALVDGALAAGGDLIRVHVPLPPLSPRNGRMAGARVGDAGWSAAERREGREGRDGNEVGLTEKNPSAVTPIPTATAPISIHPWSHPCLHPASLGSSVDLRKMEVNLITRTQCIKEIKKE
jgi:hypothetical protein